MGVSRDSRRPGAGQRMLGVWSRLGPPVTQEMDSVCIERETSLLECPLAAYSDLILIDGVMVLRRPDEIHLPLAQMTVFQSLKKGLIHHESCLLPPLSNKVL